MTDKLQKFIDATLEQSELVEKILTDSTFGRESLAKELGTSEYYARQIIDHIKKTEVSILSEEERAKEPIDADEWIAPNKWVYDKNFVYNNDDEVFIFMTREFGNLVRPKTWVKSLVQAYSDWDGKPATINEVCRRFGITRGVFSEIKKILGLTHDHEPFTPDEIADKSPEEMAMEAHQMKRFQTKVEFDKLDWKETQKEAEKWRNIKQSILDETRIEAGNLQVEQPPYFAGEARSPSDIVLHTGDWHLGAEAVNLPSIPDFNSKVLLQYIDTMVEAVRNDFPNSKVHIMYKGDTMETVTGMNHPDSWKNIEKGYYGAKAILESERYLLHLIKKIGASSFYAVTGNHGRITSDRRKDSSGEAELIVYQHIKDLLATADTDVEYDEYKISKVINGIGYIVFHGHHNFSKKSKDLIVEGIKELGTDYIMLMQGHLHERKVVFDSQHGRHLVVPSLFTGHDYNQRSGYESLSGFTVSYKHPTTGKVQLLDYSL